MSPLNFPLYTPPGPSLPWSYITHLMLAYGLCALTYVLWVREIYKRQQIERDSRLRMERAWAEAAYQIRMDRERPPIASHTAIDTPVAGSRTVVVVC